MAREILVKDDPAAFVGEILAKAGSGGGHIVLTGGNTPRASYERAAQFGGDWSRATVWWSDERCVPPDHEQSNFGLTNKSLLSRLDSAPEIWRIEGERGPEEASARYRDDIARKLGSGIPRFDFILLGLGHDGHCASLFPNDDALGVQDQTAVGVPTPGMAPFVPRVSLTLPVLNAAHEVVFLVTGFEKAMPVRRAFVNDPSPAIPASLVSPASGNLMVVLDEDAAMGLRKE